MTGRPAVLLADTREQLPLDFSRCEGWFAGIERKALKPGDYSIAGFARSNNSEIVFRLLRKSAHSLGPGEGCSGASSDTTISNGKIVSIPQVGGLHHRYERRTAA
jgi:hypothetical protein